MDTIYNGHHGYQCDHLALYTRCYNKATTTVQIRLQQGLDPRLMLCEKHESLYRNVFDCVPSRHLDHTAHSHVQYAPIDGA